MYADLFVKSELDLKIVVEFFVVVCRRVRMGVHVNKSKVMVVEREEDIACEVRINKDAEVSK